ncbi:hypothetical protein F5148DRAFT_1010542 [Russula earlei]|uniref:Uncharacterized protein n=1 Tax=Russula earlei TaxID=71964 RepID=A0ACC0UHJ2_9AGAM|nr:hypothetical protein F5148DRAFT_1010542 [Russula earlei]
MPFISRTKSPLHEHHQFCTLCGDTETMDHIIIQCETSPRRLIWSLARKMWPHRPNLWPNITLGTVMGCGALSPPTTENRKITNENTPPLHPPKGAKRLLQILTSEAAYLIWVLRCERSIQGRTHTIREMNTRWEKSINKRLTNDKITAKLVENTWEGVLLKQMDLPPDWLQNREVLVGRRLT